MEKNQAFEIVLQVVGQFRGTIQECNAVQEAVSLIGKEIKYKPKEAEEMEEATDLEESIKKK